MKLVASHIYHVYNQGNNGEQIFLRSVDYLDFLKKVQHLVCPNCTLLAYCLMPNHFHFLLVTTERSVESLMLGSVRSTRLSNAFRLLLSGYAQDFNSWNNRKGSLFRQKTKAKDLTEVDDPEYFTSCFDYIHQNPVDAGLVKHAADWTYSSLQDFLLIRAGTLCDQEQAFSLLGIDREYVKETAGWHRR
jgi:putative transposase